MLSLRTYPGPYSFLYEKYTPSKILLIVYEHMYLLRVETGNCILNFESVSPLQKATLVKKNSNLYKHSVIYTPPGVFFNLGLN